MNILMIILCVASASASIFLISKYGFKKKESEEYINSEKRDY